MADAFLSYSRKDKAFAVALRERLEAAGFEILPDVEDILPSEDWARRLVDMIAAADHVVFPISPDSCQSRVCSIEIETALDLSKSIIPGSRGSGRRPPVVIGPSSKSRSLGASIRRSSRPTAGGLSPSGATRALRCGASTACRRAPPWMASSSPCGARRAAMCLRCGTTSPSNCGAPPRHSSERRPSPRLRQRYYESLATPFEWRFTKDDLAALLRKLERTDATALAVVA
jgi:hypothetical protein